MLHFGNIVIAHKFPAPVVVPRREGHDLVRQAQQVFGFAGKDDRPLAVIPVVEGADADGVPGGDELVRGAVIEDAGEFRVQQGEHVRAVFLVHGEQDLAVGGAVKDVALFCQLLFERFKAVDLAVADGEAAVQLEGLHPGGGEAHDGQTVKAQHALPGLNHPAVVGSPAFCAVKAPLNGIQIGHRAAISDNRTHDLPLSARLRPRRRDGAAGTVGLSFILPQTADRRKWGRASIF